MRPQSMIPAATSALLLAFEALPAHALNLLADHVTLPNAREGDEYSQRISGLVPGGDVTFAKGGSDSGSGSSSDSSWVQVSSDGVISGTPDSSSGDASVSVLATSDNGTVTARFTVPVRPSGSPLLERLNVLTFNMWHGGTQVNDHHEKQVRFLASSGADVVGLQEDQDGRVAPALAESLGWHHWASGGSTSVLSKYPIDESYGVINASSGVRVALDGQDQQVDLFDVHLGYTPYGPYDFCFDAMTEEEVLEREAESGRTGQITDTLAFMESHLEAADEVPVLLVGDFNAPSHLDWTDDLADKNCGYANVRWPTSVGPEGAGLTDSFRVANPDPVDEEGITWSPLFPWNADRDLPEPQDRIDFIYFKGRGLEVLASETVVVGNPRPDPDYEDNEWTTDHTAVLTTFELASS